MTLVNADTGEIVEPLDRNEADALADAEVIIEAGLATFVEVGDALSAIRDGRLYRLTHATFEDYCRERWGMARPTAYQLIQAAESVSAIADIAPDAPRPATESQARALSPLKRQPEKMAEAMQSASAATGGRPTAQAISDAVSEIVEREQQREEQRAEDRAALKQLADEVNPPNFDPAHDAELTRQRGQLKRLCRDLASLPTPAEFVASHAAHADSLRSAAAIADEAYAWLDSFLLEMEAHR